MLRTRRTSAESTNGAVVLNETTDSPNGADTSTAVRKPATAVVRIRIGPVVRRSQAVPDGRAPGRRPSHRTARPRGG